ncbi:unnamed protein product [Malus baccata var. baccata]
MAPYWNVIFDDVEAGIDATPEDKSKGRQFEEFSVTMEVRLRTVIEALEEERRARMKLSDRGKDIAPTRKLPTFDVDLLEIIEAENANNVAQSLLRILQFRVVGELGEEQVSTLERKTRTQRSASMVPILTKALTVSKRMWRKRKGLQLVHPFTSLESYRRWKVGDGHSVEFPKPLRIIPKSDVEVFIDVLTS